MMTEIHEVKFPTGCRTLPGSFWSAVDVWVKRPHVVNKRLCGATEEEEEKAGEEQQQQQLQEQEQEEVGTEILGALLRLPYPTSTNHRDLLSFLTCGLTHTGTHTETETPTQTHTETQTQTHTETQTQTHTETQTHTQTPTHTQAHTETHTETQTQTHDKKHKTWRLIVRTVIPKVNCYGSTSHKEFVLRDFGRLQVTFVPFEEDASGQLSHRTRHVYQIRLVQRDVGEWSLVLHVLPGAAAGADGCLCDGVAYPRQAWLSTILLPRLLRWASDPMTSQFKSTLSLLPVEKYAPVYQQLKDKYRAMVKVWPEVTDPEKFVYEDVAIATYLLVLWGEERAETGAMEKQSFVDLGCGNGLLVHILSNEGHPGKGIDVRRRKIWDMYGPQTCLEEKAITPGEDSLFPATDWLIGNHSDELTPWIPVMAARSSFSCRYFVLPCCFYDFYGKFQRRRCGTSQYKEYIEYIAEISRASGFHTEEDCLRIPSTKRVCLVGKSRSYAPSDGARAEERRASYIQRRRPFSGPAPPARPPSGGGDDGDHERDHDGDACDDDDDDDDDDGHDNGGGCHDNNGDWGAGFQPRERVERVRNCAALPRDFVDGVVLRVAKALLGPAEDEGPPATAPAAAAADGIADWNLGESLSVREVAELLDQDTLQRLKSECGGLQTLLKNNHQVFRVEGGRVHIRDWRGGAEEGRGRGRGGAGSKRGRPVAADALKTRACWFHAHHPQGCPLQAGLCCFAHGPQDLRPSTKPLKKFKWSAL